MSSRRTDLVLGLFFFAALFGLGAVTIVLSDFALGAESHTIELYSADVGYLRPGDPVLLHGMASGKVIGIERLAEPRLLSARGANAEQPDVEYETTVRITAKLDVNPFDHLKPDFRINIEERGLLGGKLIRIEAGSGSGQVAPDLPLVAVASDTVLKSAGSILEENRDSLRKTMDNLQTITDTIAEGDGTIGRLVMDGGVADQLEATLSSARELLADVEAGEGTLGRLFTDGQIADDVEAITGDMRSFTDRIRRGEGTLGKIVQDDTLYNDASAVFSDLKQVSADLAAGEGTLGKLLSDDAMHEDVSAVFANAREITDGIIAGEGTAGRLFTDDSLYENVDEAFAGMRELVDGVTDGDGLLAALINDKDMAEDLRQILDQVLGAIEDARETTPVQSVGSFLFGTF